MNMRERPIIIFPEPTSSERGNKRGGPPSSLSFPSHEGQRNRLKPKFEQLQRSMQDLVLESQPYGIEPEMVLVLDTKGEKVDDFLRAVARIDGMEELLDWDEWEMPPDQNFYNKMDNNKTLDGRFYLIMSNQQGLNQLLSLRKRWEADRNVKFEYGLNKWREVFNYLDDIRRWGPEDRLKETGLLEEWQIRKKEGQDIVNIEIELWFKSNSDQRRKSESLIEVYVKEQDGEILSHSCIEAIRYHALLARLPIQAVEGLLKLQVKLVHCEQVMLFRPVGQVAVKIPDDEYLDEAFADEQDAGETDYEPIVALLDGFPLQNHERLAGKLIIDDPDGWENDYLVSKRIHGTAMASLILNGELDAEEPELNRPLYVRPILKPDPANWPGINRERIPEAILPVDLIHRCVRRIFDGDGVEPPVAPSVRVINLSIGDPNRPLYQFPSAWARLLDWLSVKYNVLFIVSAGNYGDPIELDILKGSFNNLKNEPESLRNEFLKGISQKTIDRRLFSPAESVNALTVGALHADESPSKPYSPQSAGFYEPMDLLNVIPIQTNFLSQDLLFPSPINAQGPGFHRSIKPEILTPGGRLLYREKIGNDNSKVILEAVETTLPPGQRVACPPKAPGDLKATNYSRGTSNAAALVTRNAARLYEVIQTLRNESGGDLLKDDCVAVLLKTLLVHNTSWGNLKDFLMDVLAIQERKFLDRLIGYGQADVERTLFCTERRATLLGCGYLNNGDAHLYRLPLPPSLSGKVGPRRLIATLAWFTPINPNHQKYRRADLWIQMPNQSTFNAIFPVTRQEADANDVMRGTVQHEILEGTKAVPIADNAELPIRVNCREDAGRLTEEVPYALAVTLEIAPELNVSIYDEIRERIRPPVEIVSKV
jgi:hypothetical protein